MFTLKDIRGAVVEKKLHKEFAGISNYETVEDAAFNNALDAQSQVRLQFNREKLIEMVRNKVPFFDERDGSQRPIYDIEVELLADAIIAADKELIEVVK